MLPSIIERQNDVRQDLASLSFDLLFITMFFEMIAIDHTSQF